jgi:hypothetical protein
MESTETQEPNCEESSDVLFSEGWAIPADYRLGYY